MFDVQNPWLDGYGAIREIDVNGEGATAEQVKPPVRQVRQIKDLPRSREGQRLVRVPDWVADGPFWLLAESNGRILRLGLGYNGAADYLDQMGWRPFAIDCVLYKADRWARRQGCEKPIYPLCEADCPVYWDVCTEQEVR